ncbi:golgin subfamily A member 6-like protein 22 [Cardiocondyla obscurior]|uniref:golgin subfamily A member 6-like protein 22 n=1 Tax=Cardiocondyla obscurior TaxID=286306 RepID=UPI0039656A3C
MGGIVMGWRKEFEGEREREMEKKKGVLGLKICWGRVKWKIIGVYISDNMEEVAEMMKGWMEEKEEGCNYLIGGDFNVRTGEEEGIWDEFVEEEGEEKKRRSKDKKITGEGRKFCKMLEEEGWEILNECVKGDEEEEWTYTGGRGETVIDYVICNGETKRRIKEMRVKEEVDSDHYPIIKEGKKKKEGKWKDLSEWVREVKNEVRREVNNEDGERKEKAVEDWWDEECKRNKTKVKEELEEWRKGGGSGKEYKKSKREYKKLCDRKKEEEKRKWEKEVEQAKTEEEVWKIVNKGRKGRREVDEKIEIREWEEYFRGVLGGVEWRVGGEVERNLDEELKKGGWGGTKIKGRRVYSLAYADDIALIAETEAGIKGMLKTLEEYVEKKGLENGDQKEHVKERVKKAARVMGQIWNIGKKKFGKDWGRRLWLFDRLVWTVMSYGVEIWRWKEREEIKMVHERYLRWIMGIGRRKRGGFGKRMLGRNERESEGRKQVGNGKRKEKFFERLGWTLERIEERREEEGMRGKEIVVKDKELQRKERWEKIRMGKFNKDYGKIKEEGVPEYLKKGWKEEKWQRVGRFRVGDDMRGNRYWEEIEKKSAGCLDKEETWKHVWEECVNWGDGRSWKEAIGDVLGGEGNGEEWLRIPEGGIMEVRKECKRRQKSVKLIEEKGREEEKNKDKKML